VQPNYPSPIVVCSTTGTGLQAGILDVGGFLNPGYPPVMQIVISNTATVVVYGALQVSTAATPALVDPIDLSGGGFTVSEFYDLVPGIRFYQIDVTANTGTVTVKAGVGPMTEGFVGLPQLLRISNVATAGM
jgi:hypothetical protein